jgi:hypothetical protein
MISDCTMTLWTIKPLFTARGTDGDLCCSRISKVKCYSLSSSCSFTWALRMCLHIVMKEGIDDVGEKRTDTDELRESEKKKKKKKKPTSILNSHLKRQFRCICFPDSHISSKVRSTKMVCPRTIRSRTMRGITL